MPALFSTTKLQSRMWSGFSSEIETHVDNRDVKPRLSVACGAASHLRLKLAMLKGCQGKVARRMWSGFSSEIETCSVM